MSRELFHRQDKTATSHSAVATSDRMERMALSWHVATTKPMKGMLAERELMKQGFEQFNPKVKDRITERVRPYVPGYIFVRFDVELDRWQPINFTRGVGSLMYSSFEMPAVVSDQAMVPLMEMCEDGFVDEPYADKFLFKVGNVARVLEGPFEGFEGRVTMSTPDRIKVLLEVFGRKTPVEGGSAMFEPV